MKGWLRRRVDRHPVLWVALLGAAAVLVADGAWLAGLPLAIGVVAGLLVERRWQLLAVALGVALVAGWSHGRGVAGQHQRAAAVGKGRPGEVSGRVVGRVRSASAGWSALVRVDASHGGGRVWFRGFGRPPAPGDRVSGGGRFQALPQRRNPGAFDVGRWLFRQGVFAVFRASGVSIEEGGSAVAGERVREWFRTAVTRGLDPRSREVAVIRAVVLGEHPNDDVLIDPFRRSGTLHVFAVSGLHVGMVGLLGWMLLGALGVPRRSSIPLLVALMFFYAWLTGMKPPAVRAATMATVVLAGFWLKRRPDVVNALGLALLWVVLSEPHRLFHAGVQLSFGVVFAIGWLAGPCSRPFGWISRAEPYLPRQLYRGWQSAWLGLRRKVVGVLSVSTAAWAGSAPLTAFYFGLFTPVSIPASALLSVPVFLMLGSAFLAAVLSPLPAVGERINRLNGGLARTTLALAEGAAQLPGGHLAVPRDRPAEDFLIVYDLGSDGAAVLHDGGSTTLVDGGSRRSFEGVLGPSLRRMALRPAAFVMTHPETGHAGGLVEALDAFPLRRGLVPVLEARSPVFRDLLVAADDRGVRLRRGRVGRPYPLSPGATLEVLHEPPPRNLAALADDRVMPVRLDWQGSRVLFLADSGWQLWRSLRESGVDVRAEVLVIGRHLHDREVDDGLLAAVQPRVIIATHDDFPASERLSPRWRRNCERRGIRVFHQGECGAVTMTHEEGELVLRGFVDGSECRVPPGAAD